MIGDAALPVGFIYWAMLEVWRGDSVQRARWPAYKSHALNPPCPKEDASTRVMAMSVPDNQAMPMCWMKRTGAAKEESACEGCAAALSLSPLPRRSPRIVALGRFVGEQWGSLWRTTDTQFKFFVLSFSVG